jgi:hypothetical protein
MHAELYPHPDTPRGAVASLSARVERNWKYGLTFTYVLHGDLAAIRFPAPAEPERINGLWKTTCFEAFLRDPGSQGYCEYNFSPSTAFAIYGFDAYREGMKAGYCSRAEITSASHGSRFELTAGIGFQRALQVRGDGPVLLGLSAVIEETNGAKSYWALAHPPGKPDFHHADAFALELAEPS